MGPWSFWSEMDTAFESDPLETSQAGSLGKGGRYFILGGTPIRIMDMARDIIQLSGYIPDKDIQIQVTGLRPGEKLYEELITQGEDIVQTGHEDIMVLNTNGSLPLWHLQREIRSLVELARRADAEGIKLGLQRIVPEYTPEMAKPHSAESIEHGVSIQDARYEDAG